MTGHECADVQLDEDTCDHIIEQIPPPYTGGVTFIWLHLKKEEFMYLRAGQGTMVLPSQCIVLMEQTLTSQNFNLMKSM